MRPPNKSRSRNKNNRRNNNIGNALNRVYESSGPEGRVRGTPVQVIEKYQALAHDSSLAGDRVATENFQQHAEHYIRLINDVQRQLNERREAAENANGGGGDRHSNGADQGGSNGDGGRSRGHGNNGSGPAPAPVAAEPAGMATDNRGGLETMDSGQEAPSALVETPETAPQPDADAGASGNGAEQSAKPPRSRRGRPPKKQAEASGEKEAPQPPSE